MSKKTRAPKLTPHGLQTLRKPEHTISQAKNTTLFIIEVPDDDILELAELYNLLRARGYALSLKRLVWERIKAQGDGLTDRPLSHA